MTYGVPIVQQGPQLIYGDWSSLPIPNLNMVPLVSMHEVDHFATRYWRGQDEVPVELGGTIPPTLLSTWDPYGGMSGLAVSNPKPPKEKPPVVSELNPRPAMSVPESTINAVILVTGIVVLASAAAWAWSKFKK